MGVANPGARAGGQVHGDFHRRMAWAGSSRTTRPSRRAPRADAPHGHDHCAPPPRGGPWLYKARASIPPPRPPQAPMTLPADLAAYAEPSDPRKAMGPMWTPRVFNRTEVQEGSSIRFD